MAAAASLTMSARASPVPAAMPASSKASYSHSSEGSGPHRALLPPVRRVRARARPIGLIRLGLSKARARARV